MIQISNLSKNFGDLKVLDQVSLEIKEGDIYGIIGQSGAGKSTLLRCINGLEGYNGGSLKVEGKEEADLLIVGFGGTYGHLCEAMQQMNNEGKKVALAHFQYINPLPRNTEEVLRKYKKIVVAEQNMGQFAGYLQTKISDIKLRCYNEVKGQPFTVATLVEEFTKIMEE